MVHYNDRIKNKLRSRAGVSIGEMLVCILIVLMVSSVMVTTVSLAARRFQESMRRSEANVLASDLRYLISYELQYDTTIKDSETVTVFAGQGYDKESFSTSQGTDYGYIILVDESGADASSEDAEGYKYLLGEGAYPNGLRARVDSITYDSSANAFSVKMSVAYKGTVYWDETFSVLKVNKTYDASDGT